jgi:hypothetical protein
VFAGFLNNDWKSATPPSLMEAVLSIRKLAGDGFFRIDALLQKEEFIRREPHPWVYWGACYKEREQEAKRGAQEIFEKFLQIGAMHPSLINDSPVAWAYGQTECSLLDEFGSARSLQEFYKIKLWIKEYCDGKDKALPPEVQCQEEWKDYLCRETWRAPVWLKIASIRYFTNNSSAWGDFGDQGAFHRLNREETEELLNRICHRFWSSVKAGLENTARQESINLATRRVDESLNQVNQAEYVGQALGEHLSADEDELSKRVREGRTVELLRGQLKKIRRLYREKGWSPSQIRHNTAHDLTVVWEWIDEISDHSHKSQFLKVSDWDDGDAFIYRQIATLYEYAPHLSKKPSWSTLRDWRKAFRGYERYKTPDGRKPRS